ncbi:MAG: hypothetical protein ABSG86_19255 [Thermoguttaceae bacterium]|jgi:hypothetical protein
MFEALSRFIDQAGEERISILRAVDADEWDLEYQAKLKAFNNGEAGRAGEVFYPPIGRTEQLLRTIDPESGYGQRDKSYQAALAEAAASELGSYLLPKLEAADKAHEDLCSQAKAAAAGTYGRVEDPELEAADKAHEEAFKVLVHLVNSQATRPAAPAVEDLGAKGHRKPGKWDHVWQIIQEQNAVEACGKDQTIANMHNKVCAKRISSGTCERIDVKKVAQIRYEYTHPDRHRKQNHKKRP